MSLLLGFSNRLQSYGHSNAILRRPRTLQQARPKPEAPPNPTLLCSLRFYAECVADTALITTDKAVSRVRELQRHREWQLLAFFVLRSEDARAVSLSARAVDADAYPRLLDGW